MWEEYMRDLLGWKEHQTSLNSNDENKKKSNKQKKIINIGDEQFRMRICRADFHGALIKITKSRVPSQLGLQVGEYFKFSLGTNLQHKQR